MRSYPKDSPQSQARIVIAALLADGGLDKSELDLLDCRSITEQLNISETEFNAVMHDFWNDTNQYALLSDGGELQIGTDAIKAMLAEISDRDTQAWLLRVIHELVYVDRNLSVGEAQLVSLAMTQWNVSKLSVNKTYRSRSSFWPQQVRRAAAEACS